MNTNQHNLIQPTRPSSFEAVAVNGAGSWNVLGWCDPADQTRLTDATDLSANLRNLQGKPQTDSRRPIASFNHAAAYLTSQHSDNEAIQGWHKAYETGANGKAAMPITGIRQARAGISSRRVQHLRLGSATTKA